jgi:hypothetical protein
VEFDLGLAHQDPYRTETNRIYLQVHNRGYQATNNVWVRAFVADAHLGLPALPNALSPPNFDLTSTTVWTPVGAAQMIPTLHPNRPAIVSWDFTVPSTTATHTCCLAVVSSGDDPFSNPATDVATLVSQDKRVCLKNLHMVDPGPAPVPMTLIAIDMHNPRPEEISAELVVRPSLFERGTIGLLLPNAEVEDPDGRSFSVEKVPLAENDPVGRWYLPGREKNQALVAERWRGLDRRFLWTLHSTQVSRLAGIRIKAGETLRAALVCSHRRDVPTSVAPQVSIEMRAGGVLLGGSTFQIGYDGQASPAQPKVRRVRLVAKRVRWRDTRATLWVRTTIADDVCRTVLRPLELHRHDDGGETCLYDGYLLEGESLTLFILETEKGGAEVLYRRDFEGSIDAWLGAHHAHGREHLDIRYTVEEVVSEGGPEAD